MSSQPVHTYTMSSVKTINLKTSQPSSNNTHGDNLHARQHSLHMNCSILGLSNHSTQWFPAQLSQCLPHQLKLYSTLLQYNDCICTFYKCNLKHCCQFVWNIQHEVSVEWQIQHVVKPSAECYICHKTVTNCGVVSYFI